MGIWRTAATAALIVLSIGLEARADVWAVGDNGTIIHTAGAGSPWVASNSGTSNGLYGVSFPTANDGWVVGNSVVLHTTDGGATWTPQKNAPTANFKAVQFLDPDHGWILASNNSFYQTVDGGQNWTSVNISNFGGGGSSGAGVHFFDLNDGWAAFFGSSLWQTTDGGKTWTARTSPELFLSMQVIDQNHIWAGVDSGLVMHTDDAGADWTSNTFGSTNEWSVSFADDDQGWALGNTPFSIESTTDGGATWIPENTGSPGITYLLRADDSHGWVFSIDGDIEYSTNGGNLFVAESSPTGNDIRGAVVGVPEPQSLALFASGALLLLMSRPRRRRCLQC